MRLSWDRGSEMFLKIIYDMVDMGGSSCVMLRLRTLLGLHPLPLLAKIQGAGNLLPLTLKLVKPWSHHVTRGTKSPSGLPWITITCMLHLFQLPHSSWMFFSGVCFVLFCFPSLCSLCYLVSAVSIETSWGSGNLSPALCSLKPIKDTLHFCYSVFHP